MTRTARYTYHQPAAELQGTAPALREVRREGQPVGLLNAVRGGYALRRLDGHRIDVAYGVSRETAAGLLDQATSPEREAAAALAATPTAELLTKAYALTHQMDRLRPDRQLSGERRTEVQAKQADLRAARDLITAEVLRRAGEQA